MKSLNEYMSKIQTVHADSELKEKTINFETVEDFIKYTEDTWEKALNDSTFVKNIQKFLSTKFSSNDSEISIDEDGDIAVYDLEETGLVYNGEIFGFWCTDGYENGYSDCTITLRDKVIKTTRDNSGKGDIVWKEFSNPVTVAGKSFEEQYDFKTPKLKELSKKLLKIIDKVVKEESDDTLKAYRDGDGNMTDAEFHRWANLGLGR